MDLFTEQEKNQLRESFLELIPRIDRIAEAFYQRLFNDFPHVRKHFKSDLASQREKLVDTIAALLDVLNQAEQAEQALRNLGRIHTHYGTDEAIYRWVERTFVQLLEEETLRVPVAVDREVIARLWPRLMHFVVVNMQEGSYTQ